MAQWAELFMQGENIFLNLSYLREARGQAHRPDVARR